MAIDTYSGVKYTNAISPATTTGVGTKTGAVIDTAGYRSNTFIFHSGIQSVTATVVPVILSGTVTGTLASCAAAELIGTEAAAAAIVGATLTTGAVAAIGYIGTDRYVRCDLIIGGVSTGFYSAILAQSDAIKK